MLFSRPRSRGALVGALVAASLSLVVPPAQPIAGPGSPPRVFTYLRSTDAGETFTPFQLAETPEAGITHVEASGGTVHALYDDQDPQPRRLFYRRSSDDGASWDRSIRLDRPSAGSVEHGDSGEADLATDGKAVHVVWEDDRFLANDFTLPVDVRLSNDVVLSDGTVLDSETPPGEDNDEASDNTILPAGTVFPAGSVDPRVDGRFFSTGDGLTLGAGDEEEIDNRDDVFYTRSDDDGASFPVARNVSDSPNVHNRDPDVAGDGDLVVIAYEGEDVVGEGTDADDVLVAVSDDGGKSFKVNRNLNLTNAPGDQDEPAVGVHGSTVHVVIRDAVPDPADPDEELLRPIGYVRSTDGGRRFSRPVSLPVSEPAGDFTASSTPAVLVQGDAVHVVACHEDDSDSDSDGNDLLYWRSADGGRTFDRAVVIDRAEEPCNKPALDGAGDQLWVALERDVHAQSDVFVLRSRDGGRTWGDLRNVSDDHESSIDPSVSVDPADPDDVHVSWSDSSDFLFTLHFGQKLPVDAGEKRRFANEDVIRFTGGAYKMVLDGSDVGLADLRIDALGTVPPADPEDAPEFVLSFTEAATLPGLGEVDDSDLVLFTPTSLGERTAGSFRLYLDGSDIGLDDASENVDAVEVDGSSLYLSTSGDFTAGGVSGRDEDVFACTDFRPGAESACDSVSLAFNGSSVGLGGNNEDIDAFSFTGEGNVPEGAAFFSALGPYRLSTASGGKADVFSCVFPEEPPGAGPLASCGRPEAPVHTVFSDENHLLDENIMSLEFQY